jgi:large subunit ribosomal protein L21
MYAVVSTGGKQYRVEPGTQLSVERLPAEPGASVTFDRVLLVGDGEQVSIGTPVVDGATVTATVLGQERGPKIVIFKFKQKVKYRRRTGHRQELTRVRIDRIDADGRSASIEEAPVSAKTDTAPAEKAPAASAAEAEAPKPKRSRRPKASVAAESADQADATITASEAEQVEAASVEEAPAKPRRTRKTAKPAAKADAAEAEE